MRAHGNTEIPITGLGQQPPSSTDLIRSSDLWLKAHLEKTIPHPIVLQCCYSLKLLKNSVLWTASTIGKVTGSSP